METQPENRTPQEIRASMEVHRAQLGKAVNRLRIEYEAATDPRVQFLRHRKGVLITAAVVGFWAAGGFDALKRFLAK
jgi:hypothetical protein